MKKSWIFSSLILLLLGACSKDDTANKDLEKPQITWLKNLPDTLNGGDTLYFNLSISDNQDLSQAKFEIHDNFDGHSHKKGGVLAFRWDSIIDLSDNPSILNFFLVLPIDLAAGNYDVLVQALDKSGNEADFYAQSTYFRNPLDTEAPKIQNLGTNPQAISGIINIKNAGDTLFLVADISDDQALDKIEVLLESKTGSSIVYDFDEEALSSNYTFKHFIRFDASWPEGNYLLHLKLVDLKGNNAEEELEIKFTH